MKKLLTNENDKYLLNDMKHDKRMMVSKKIKRLVSRDAKELCSIGLLSCTLVISAKSIIEFGGMLVSAYDSIKYAMNSDVQERNDEGLSDIFNNGYVSVFNVPTSFESQFHFENQYLYDEDNKVVTLENYSDPIYFLYCNLDNKTFENIRLRESKTKELCLNYSCIDDKCLECLPESVEELGLSYCFLLKDLGNLPVYCPNIRVLYLDSLIGVKDFSFLARFENLQEVSISNSAYITEDLINYLDSRKIKHNLTDDDILNNKITDEIVEEIITPNMSDKEKIKRICGYVLDHIEYDINKSRESNLRPLNCVFEDGKGVCISYAYLTSVLLDKANVNNFLLTNNSHAWNMVNIDDKYYYIDTTGMDSTTLNRLLLEVFNVGFCYMSDTENTTISSMSKLQSGNVNIPVELLNDVLSGREEKDIFEKYGETVDATIFWLCYAIKGFFMFYTPRLIVNLKRKSQKIIRDYKRL